MKKILLSLLVVSTAFATYAQKFEGIIISKIEYDELPEELAGFEAMLPSENTLKIKNEKSRVETNTMGGSSIAIMDSKKKSGVILIDMMGQKIAMEITPDDMKKGEEESKKEKFETKITKETKKIAGYNCTKAIVTDSEGNEVDVWFTKEIPSVESETKKIGGDFEGFPMQYSMSQQGMSMTVTVSKITKEAIADSEFETPEGYTVMTQEELQNSFGGGM